MRKIAVIGLGRFGMRLARELGRSGLEVIAADRNGRLVEEVKEYVAVAVQMDSTDENAMRALSIGEVDVCVVAIGEGFEAALMSTLLAKQLGAKTVLARAQTQTQADILRRVGADQVIQPENEVARELARRLANPLLEDFIELGEENGVVQLLAPRGFVGKTLNDLKLRTRYQVNLVAIRRKVGEEAGPVREQTITVPPAEDTVREGDVLILVGRHEDLERLPQK
jgi:trk system potassium uptake protein TrkA